MPDRVGEKFRLSCDAGHTASDHSLSQSGHSLIHRNDADDISAVRPVDLGDLLLDHPIDGDIRSPQSIERARVPFLVMVNLRGRIPEPWIAGRLPMVVRHPRDLQQHL